MKKIITLLAIVFSLGLKAQESGDFVIGLNGNYPLINKEKEIKTFQNGYAETWQASIDKSWHSSGIPYNLQVTATWWLSSSIGICLDYSFSKYQQEINFTDNTKRVFEYTVRNPIEGGFSIGKPKIIYANFKFGFATSTFSSIYQYKDGQKDMNYNSPLNGVYSANGFSYRVELLVKLTKNIALVGSYGCISGSEYSDKNFFKGADIHAGTESPFFPTDYALFNNLSSSGNVYEYPYDQWAKLKYSSASVGIQYQFKLFHKDFDM
jgi:hypothetical protein